MFPGTFLFALSIADNISFGAGDLPLEQVRYLAEIAEIATEIDGFSKGFETMVGERGVTLSGGQKQRIAIARALAVSPRILVLDDSLSAIDTETESAIQEKLKREIEGLTNIIIAHRISTIRTPTLSWYSTGAGWWRAEPRRTPSEGWLYAELYRMQQLEEEAEKCCEGGDG